MRPLLLSVLALLALAAPAGASHGESRTRVGIGSGQVNGAPQDALRGHVVIRTPRASFRHANRDGWRTAHFDVTVTDTCGARAQVSTRAEATRLGPRAQVRRVKGGEILAEGGGPRTPWRLEAFRGFDESTYETTDELHLYGIAVRRLARRRWLHVRAFAFFDPSYTEEHRRDGAAATGLARLLRTARLRGSLVRG